MRRTLVKHALASETAQDCILVEGWVRTRRDSKAFSFLEINDGTSLASIQVIASTDKAVHFSFVFSPKNRISADGIRS